MGMKKQFFLVVLILGLLFSVSTADEEANVRYLDYVNGNDSNNGTTWALAWKTFDHITTSNMVAGDTLKVAKSPDSVSVGNGTWTNSSTTVTLAGALTANISNCDTAWTAATNATQSNETTNRKEGTYSQKFIIADAFAANGQVAYKAFTSVDFSAYDTISLWIKSTVMVATNTFRIDVCSDVAGATRTDSIIITDSLEPNHWYPVVKYSTALGSATRSIALFARLDPGVDTVYLDNILACNGLNLTSLLSKGGVGETWWTIRSINGTTIKLGDIRAQSTDSIQYYGSTNTVTTYSRATIPTLLVDDTSTSSQKIQNKKWSSPGITIIGGYNTSTSLRDGLTIFDGTNGLGRGLEISYGSPYALYITVKGISMVRYWEGYYFYYAQKTKITNAHSVGNYQYGVDFNYSANCFFDSSYFCGNYNGNFTIQNSGKNDFENSEFSSPGLSSASNGFGFRSWTGSFLSYFKNCKFRSTVRGLYTCTGTDARIIAKDCVFSNNSEEDVRPENSNYYLYNCLLDSPTEIFVLSSTEIPRSTVVRSQNHDQTPNRDLYWTATGTVSDQVTGGQAESFAKGGSGMCILLNPTSTTDSLEYSFKVPCTANTSFTISFYHKKSVAGGNPTLQISAFGSGITEISRQTVTLATDTAWTKYTSSSMTPTQTGFVEVTLLAWDGSTSCDIGIDDISTSAGGYSNFGECNHWWWAGVDGGIVGNYFGSLDRWNWGLPDGGITNATVSSTVTKKIRGTANVEDVWIDNMQLDKNWGAFTYLVLYEDWGEYYNALIRVKNVATLLGAGATNITAICSLYCYSHERNPDTIYAYRVFKPFKEGIGTGQYCGAIDTTINGATWGDWNCLNLEWGTAGCGNASDAGTDNSGDGSDYDRKATAESPGVLINANGWYGFPISSELATAWYNGTANENGILLKGVLVSQGLNYFYSTEYTADTTLCPFFVFTYTPGEVVQDKSTQITLEKRFPPWFLDARFESGEITPALAEIQKIFHGGANGVDTMYANGTIQQIFK
jgi:hypothetical protein